MKFGIRMSLCAFFCIFSMLYAIGQPVKPSKEAVKIARQYEKEGWKTLYGRQSLELQIDEMLHKRLEVNQDGMPRFISVSMIAKGNEYDDAKTVALELAKMNLTSSIGETLEAMITSRVENEQTNSVDSYSSVDFVSVSKSHAIQRLGQLEPVLEFWRTGPDGSVEINITVLYDTDHMESMANDIINNFYE